MFDNYDLIFLAPIVFARNYMAPTPTTELQTRRGDVLYDLLPSYWSLVQTEPITVHPTSSIALIGPNHINQRPFCAIVRNTHLGFFPNSWLSAPETLADSRMVRLMIGLSFIIIIFALSLWFLMQELLRYLEFQSDRSALEE